MLQVTIVCGNPKSRSRTLKVAETLVAQFLGQCEADIRIIDLMDYADELLKWPSDVMTELMGRVAQSDLAVFVSPTYKASYTGLLKLFLDRYPANGLRDVTSLCLMTGADATHTLAPTVHLVPLLLELGAIVPVGGLYFNTTHMDRMSEFASVNAARIQAILSRLGSVAETVAAGNTVETRENV